MHWRERISSTHWQQQRLSECAEGDDAGVCKDSRRAIHSSPLYPWERRSVETRITWKLLRGWQEYRKASVWCGERVRLKESVGSGQAGWLSHAVTQQMTQSWKGLLGQPGSRLHFLVKPHRTQHCCLAPKAPLLALFWFCFSAVPSCGFSSILC